MNYVNITASNRMEIFSPAIFGELNEKAAIKQNEGTPIVDLSLGSPDLPPAKIIRDTLAKSSAKENMYGYTLGGTQRFHQAVANYYKRTMNVEIDAETEVLQTMGSQEGLVHLPLAFCNEGDMVLTTDTAYIAYDTGIKLANATPYYMPLHAENDFLPDLDAVPEDIAQKTSLLILNLPGNPVPATPSQAFFEKVVAFAKKYDILVLHDAAYSEYYFTDEQPASFLSTPGAIDVGLEINSLSKSFSLAGARVAYLVGNKQAIRIMTTLKSNLDYGIFAPIQEAAIVALDNSEEITNHLRNVFAKRHRILKEGLLQLGWEVAPSVGGMFIWAKYPYDIPDKDFAFEVIRQVGVVMVPGSIFGDNGAGYVRLALVQDVDNLQLAINRFGKIAIT